MPDGERSHSPMPPVAALGGHGIEVEDWQRSADLARLRQYAARQVAAADQAGWLADGIDYDALPPCLPVAD